MNPLIEENETPPKQADKLYIPAEISIITVSQQYQPIWLRPIIKEEYHAEYKKYLPHRRHPGSARHV